MSGTATTYAHRESTTKVIENDPGAGVPSVIHGYVSGKGLTRLWVVAGGEKESLLR